MPFLEFDRHLGPGFLTGVNLKEIGEISNRLELTGGPKSPLYGFEHRQPEKRGQYRPMR
jgi:hypothetical protein